MCSIEQWRETVLTLLPKHFFGTLATSEKHVPKWKETNPKLALKLPQWLEKSILEGWQDFLHPMNPTFDTVMMTSYWFRALATMLKDVTHVY